jgi:hypothetical protein
MAEAAKPWWRNCALKGDAEIQAIDRYEDEIAPIAPTYYRIRELISTLELCHHKADRWIQNIIEAIGSGKPRGGLGTRTAGQQHPVEEVWQNACAVLASWCAGCPPEKIDLSVGGVRAAQLAACMGERSPLKEWQVQRVADKIRSCINWPQSMKEPKVQYTWLLLSGGEYESVYRSECPDEFREQEDFWQSTARTLIRDKVEGEDANLSLALAIDMLMPCHWRFVDNLRIVLEAIGGKLKPEEPFAACGRNISLLPNRSRMEVIARTLALFPNPRDKVERADMSLLELLGPPTREKRWLAASLEKTIRLQLAPPPDVQAMSALPAPMVSGIEN